MLTKANGCTLRLFDNANKNLVLKAHHGVSDKWIGKGTTPLKESLIRKALEKG